MNKYFYTYTVVDVHGNDVYPTKDFTFEEAVDEVQDYNRYPDVEGEYYMILQAEYEGSPTGYEQIVCPW